MSDEPAQAIVLGILIVMGPTLGGFFFVFSYREVEENYSAFRIGMRGWGEFLFHGITDIIIMLISLVFVGIGVVAGIVSFHIYF